MFSLVRGRVSFVGVGLVVVVVLVMSGGAYAANRYLISSTKQISPKVLKSLRGKAGAKGATGAVGPAGATGAVGPAGATGVAGPAGKDGVQGKEGTRGEEGKQGPAGLTGFTETLPSEKTERGVWSVLYTAAAVGDVMSASISFNIPLVVAPHAERQTNFIGLEEGEGEPKENKGAIPAHCKGTVASPQAVPGNLCVFARTSINDELGSLGALFFDPQSGQAEVAGPSGTVMDFGAVGTGVVFVDGVWAVTAE